MNMQMKLRSVVKKSVLSKLLHIHLEKMAKVLKALKIMKLMAKNT